MLFESYPPQQVHLLFNKMTTWLRTTTYGNGAMNNQEEKYSVVEAWEHSSGIGSLRYRDRIAERRVRYSDSLFVIATSPFIIREPIKNRLP